MLSVAHSLLQTIKASPKTRLCGKADGHETQRIDLEDFVQLLGPNSQLMLVYLVAREISLVIDWLRFKLVVDFAAPTAPLRCVCKLKWNWAYASVAELESGIQAVQAHLRTHSDLCPSEMAMQLGIFAEWLDWEPAPVPKCSVPPGRWQCYEQASNRVVELVSRHRPCSCGHIEDLDHPSTRDHAVKLAGCIAAQLGLERLPEEFQVRGKKLTCARCETVVVLSVEAVRVHLESGQHVKTPPVEQPVPLEPIAADPAIDELLENYARLVTLPHNFLQSRKKFTRNLEELVRQRIPDARLVMFGSSVTGLATRESDVDLCLCTDSKRPELELLGELREHLKANRISTVLIAARVPILQFKHTKLKAFYVHAFDLCINNRKALDNTQYVAACLNYDRRIKQLALAVRAWAQAGKLANSNSGLTSYCQSLLVLFFAQTCQPPLLPCIRPELCAGLRKIAWPSLAEPNTATVSQLLREFFEFVAQFDWAGSAISTRQGRVLAKADCQFRPAPLAVEDPVDATVNCARLPTGEFVRRLVSAAQETGHRLALGQSLEFLQSPLGEVAQPVQAGPPEPKPRSLVPRPRLVKLAAPPPKTFTVSELGDAMASADAELLRALEAFSLNYAARFAERGGRAAIVSTQMSGLLRKYRALGAVLARTAGVERQLDERLAFYASDPRILDVTYEIWKKDPGLVYASPDQPSAGACVQAPRRFLVKLERILVRLQETGCQQASLSALLVRLDGLFQRMIETVEPALLWVQRRVSPAFDVMANSRRRVVAEALVKAVERRIEAGKVYATHRCVLFSDVLLFSSLADDTYCYFPRETVQLSDPEPASAVLALYSSGQPPPSPALLFESAVAKQEFIN